mmetsp:Transcript_13412/g.57168  ORF Transcript_13412/g.57168 Transcript_13412/m.57168 type:complete len:206 (+) Transcript_13412:3396-4013(+)
MKSVMISKPGGIPPTRFESRAFKSRASRSAPPAFQSTPRPRVSRRGERSCNASSPNSNRPPSTAAKDASSSPLRTASRQTRNWMRKCSSASRANHHRSSCELCRRLRSSPNTRSRTNANCANDARPASAHGPTRPPSQARMSLFTSRTYEEACGYVRARASEYASSYARSAPGTASWSRAAAERSAPSNARRSWSHRWRAAAAAP